MTILVAVVVAVALIVTYLIWTTGRIDRLHNRVTAGRAALDAHLVRRAAAARELASYAEVHRLLPTVAAERLHLCAQVALDADEAAREAAENDLSRALTHVVGPCRARWEADPEAARLVGELGTAATRVGYARAFHNNAVHDTQALRSRRVPRALHLAGHAPMPAYFEIDDTALVEPSPTVAR